jgi:hypothetical protein
MDVLKYHQHRHLQGRFGLFVSALEIPFPSNGDLGSKRPVRVRCREGSSFAYGVESSGRTS